MKVRTISSKPTTTIQNPKILREATLSIKMVQMSMNLLYESLMKSKILRLPEIDSRSLVILKRPPQNRLRNQS